MNKKTQKQLLELSKTNYNQIASEYSESRKKTFSYCWKELLEIIKKIKPNSKILDVGCGSGKLLKDFSEKEVEYLGVDNSFAMVKEAQKNYPNHRFVVGDVLELNNLPEINFDYVFCVATLHHLPGVNLRIQALKQMKNKIKQDGKIVITVWNLWSQKKFRKLIWKFLILKFIKKNKMDFGDILFDWKSNQGEFVSKRYYHAFTKRELKKIIKKAGLKIDRLFKDRFNYYLILKK